MPGKASGAAVSAGILGYEQEGAPGPLPVETRCFYAPAGTRARSAELDVQRIAGRITQLAAGGPTWRALQDNPRSADVDPMVK